MTYRCYPHCPQLPVNNSNLANCLWITFDGGEGVGRSVKVVGASDPPKKRKWKKRVKSPLSATKKKELVVSIRQDSGAIQQQKTPTMPTRWPPTRLRTALDSPAFKVNNPHACRCWRREFRYRNKITVGVISFGYYAPTLINLPYQATICYSPHLSRPQRQGQSWK